MITTQFTFLQPSVALGKSLCIITIFFQKAINTRSNEFALQCLKDLKRTCDKEIGKIVKDRISVSIESLLPLDVLQQTKDACTAIATRICLERIDEWTSSRIVLGNTKRIMCFFSSFLTIVVGIFTKILVAKRTDCCVI